MWTWAQIGLAIIRLVNAALSFIERERQLHEARVKAQAEQKKQRDDFVDEAKKVQDTFDNMSSDDRERLRNDLGSYRD